MKLHTCLIEEQTEDEAYVQVYWSRAEHLGAAIGNMLAAARANGMLNPEPRQTDPYDLSSLTEEVIPSSAAETFWADRRYYFSPEPLFQVPYGVISSCVEGDHDIDEIAPGFTLSRDESGKTTLEANVAGDHLFTLYRNLLELHPRYKVFWYLLHDHWDHGSDRFLINEALDTPEAILDHLEAHQHDSIFNGHVTLTAYLEEGATNFNLTDHKRLIIHTYSDEVAARYAARLHDLGYPRMEDLVSIERGIHHWHFRHPASRTKQGLADHLKEIGFSDWEPRRKS